MDCIYNYSLVNSPYGLETNKSFSNQAQPSLLLPDFFLNISLDSVCDLPNHVFKKLYSWETELERLFPSLPFQNQFDDLCLLVNKCFSSTNIFNSWLEENGNGDWYERLTLGLAKLPLRVARNIVRSLFNIIKIAVGIPAYALTHPLKFPIKLIQAVLNLIQQLVQPETWSKIGVGLIGSSLGHAAISANPISIFAIGIGAALSIAGITVGTLKTAMVAPRHLREEAVATYLMENADHLFEDFVTGFSTVLVLEGIQQAMRGFQKFGRWCQHRHNIKTGQSALVDVQSKQFLNDYQLPREDYLLESGMDYGVYWHVERGYGRAFGMQDLPGARFNIKDIWTRTEYETSYIWSDGYWDCNGDYVSGSLETVITPIPIYEKFFGYELRLKGWVEPPMPILGDPIRLNDIDVPYLGMIEGVDDAVEKTINDTLDCRPIE